MKKILLSTSLAGILALLVSPAQGYYHFVHYLNGSSAVEKFDLTALPGRTVTFLVSGNGPAVYSKTDSYASVISQIRQAAAIWNGVASSDLRVAFGGLASTPILQNTPGGDVVFDDLPPGVEGFGGPTSKADAAVAGDFSRYVPIVRSVIHLNRNLVLAPGPSYNQSFLLTTLHEMGHALGLQHTFTASAMSQDTIRATTLARPLDNDDIAGISALYPAVSFRKTGTIAGRISSASGGVHLASVVAIRAGAGAISAFTKPDGTYRMEGVPPGQYAVYVHSLPPDANVIEPVDGNGNPVAASGAVNSVFYPGTTDFSQATQVKVVVGQTTESINIGVTARTSVPVYDGQIFGYLANNTVANRPAPVLISSATTAVAASVTGLGSNGNSPGLAIQIPGGAVSIVPNGIVPSLSGGFTYVYLYLKTAADAQPGPQHVIFNTPGYMYVLPSAMYLTAALPPSVADQIQNADGTVTVTGTGFITGTKLYFDSLPGVVLSVNKDGNSAVVTPPAGSAGQVATLIAYNPDGQNSQLWKPVNAVSWSYGDLPIPAIVSVSPSSLPAGAEAVVDIVTANLALTQGAGLGFGSSDILVRSLTVLSPTHLRANIAVASNASLSNPDITIAAGFAIASAPASFQITPAVENLPAAVPVLININADQGITGAFPGATVALYGKGLNQQNLTTATVTFGGHAAVVSFWSSGQLILQIPLDVTPGPAVLVLNNGWLNSFPVDVLIDPAPAGYYGVQFSNGDYVTPAHAAQPGDSLIATMSGFAPDGDKVTLDRVRVSLGGVSFAPLSIQQAGPAWQVTFTIPAGVPAGATDRLILYRDGLSSVVATIPVVGSIVASDVIPAP